LALHLAGPEVSSAGIDVRVGERDDPAGLVARLEALSYAVDYVADRPGMAARRGGIVDVYPAGGETPLRIEFFGDEVDSIRVLDLASQRSLNRTDHVHLPPAGTGTSHARAAARALANSLTVDSDEADRLLEQLELV